MKNLRIITVLLIAAIAVVLCVTAFADDKAPGKPIILKGAPMGGVSFDHSKHAAAKCETCHHAAKAEKAAKTPTQGCTSCHESVAAAPMKTNKKAAFHNAAATAGVCIDCHKKEMAAGKKPPTKGTQCHQKANI